jgi:hypothetical protein
MTSAASAHRLSTRRIIFSDLYSGLSESGPLLRINRGEEIEAQNLGSSM